MQVSFKLKYKDIVVALWLVTLLACISLVWGSYAEIEAKAAQMFGIITLVVAVLGYPVLRWRNK